MRSSKFLIASVIVVFLISGVWLSRFSVKPFKSTLRQYLVDQLTQLHSLPAGMKTDVIYVLGGPPRSLRYKFKVAASLFLKGESNRIWILNRDGITEYSFSLGRNFTYDEWALDRLQYLGVPQDSVEPIKVIEGFFGTLSEAKSIPKIMQQRGLKSILVVAAPYHTGRVKVSFEHYLKRRGMSLYIESSGERGALHILLKEYCKLKVYQCLLFLDSIF